MSKQGKKKRKGLRIKMEKNGIIGGVEAMDCVCREARFCVSTGKGWIRNVVCGGKCDGFCWDLGLYLGLYLGFVETQNFASLLRDNLNCTPPPTDKPAVRCGYTEGHGGTQRDTEVFYSLWNSVKPLCNSV